MFYQLVRHLRYAVVKEHNKIKNEELRMKSNNSLTFFTLNSSLLTFGGGERDRTDDLLRAKQALSQLSYTPIGGPR
jgi:hypothetical protein